VRNIFLFTTHRTVACDPVVMKHVSSFFNPIFHSGENPHKNKIFFKICYFRKESSNKSSSEGAFFAAVIFLVRWSVCLPVQPRKPGGVGSAVQQDTTSFEVSFLWAEESLS